MDMPQNAPKNVFTYTVAAASKACHWRLSVKAEESE